MKYLEKYNLIKEAKKKVDYHAKLVSKLEYLYNICLSETGLSKEDLDDLILPLVDIYGHDSNRHSTTPSIRFNWSLFYMDNKKLYSSVYLGSNDRLYDYWLDDTDFYDKPYNGYTSIDRTLKKHKINGDKIYLNIKILVNLYDINFIEIINKPEIKQEWENLAETLESYGFEVRRNYKNRDHLNASFEIKNPLIYGERPEWLNKIPDNIIDDYEAFLVKKNISDNDGEYLSNLLSTGDWSTK